MPAPTKRPQPFWKRVIETGNQTEADLHRAITLVEQTGAIQETMRRARAYADDAKARARRSCPPARSSARCRTSRISASSGLIRSSTLSHAIKTRYPKGRYPWPARLMRRCRCSGTEGGLQPTSRAAACLQHRWPPAGSIRRRQTCRNRWRRSPTCVRTARRAAPRAPSAHRRSPAAAPSPALPDRCWSMSRKRSRSAVSWKRPRRQRHLHAAAGLKRGEHIPVGTATPGLTSSSGRRGSDWTARRISPRPSMKAAS